MQNGEEKTVQGQSQEIVQYCNIGWDLGRLLL
jgi:hypothetical protein